MIYLALRKRPKSNNLIYWISHLAIKFRIVSAYSHAAMFDGVYLYDVTATDNMKKHVLEDKENWDFFVAPVSKDLLNSRFKKYSDYKYDWFSLLAFLGLRARDSDRLYCFEWCHIAITGENPNFKVTPEKLLALCLKG